MPTSFVSRGVKTAVQIAAWFHLNALYIGITKICRQVFHSLLQISMPSSVAKRASKTAMFTEASSSAKAPVIIKTSNLDSEMANETRIIINESEPKAFVSAFEEEPM